MYMKREYRLYVKDILDSIAKIEEFAGDMDYDKFARKSSSLILMPQY